MKEITPLIVVLLSFYLLLISSCNGSVTMESTNTPDPLTMTINERTIWDFENFKNQVNDMAAEAADLSAEDLDPLIWQINALSKEIYEYNAPLIAVKAQSALFSFANSTFQCYSAKHSEYFRESIGAETLTPENFDYCDEIQIFSESFDILLQELRDMVSDS